MEEPKGKEASKMEKYDYKEQIKEDIKEYLKDNGLELNEDTRDDIYDDLWVSDSVTGNASGSYYCNAWKAEEALAHNWDLLGDMVNDGFIDGDSFKRGPEVLDVCVRCYLLAPALDELMGE